MRFMLWTVQFISYILDRMVVDCQSRQGQYSNGKDKSRNLKLFVVEACESHSMLQYLEVDLYN